MKEKSLSHGVCAAIGGGMKVTMKFTKMHGCGNDYVYINGETEQVPLEKKPDLVRKMSDRHFGIGSDGVIFINPSEVADFEMEMYNSDGSRSEMCGNGIRCVAKYVYDKGLTNKTTLNIVSFGQIKEIEITQENQKAKSIRVNMGKPELDSKRIPVNKEQPRVIDEPIQLAGNSYHVTCVSMGNPHAVVFMEEIASLNLEQVGPLFEHHEWFPNRINTEFVKVLDKSHVEMRVWERGAGETLACGTGCCATVVACVLNGLTDTKVTVKVLGGEIEIEWDQEHDVVYMTGPAAIVFEGTYEE